MDKMFAVERTFHRSDGLYKAKNAVKAKPQMRWPVARRLL
jgi:hypothetical protein